MCPVAALEREREREREQEQEQEPALELVMAALAADYWVDSDLA